MSDIEEAIAATTPLINPRLSEVDWAAVEDVLSQREPSAGDRSQSAGINARETFVFREGLAAGRPTVSALAEALIVAVRSLRAPIGYKGDGWPAYWEKDRPATVLVVTELAAAILAALDHAAAASAPKPDPIVEKYGPEVAALAADYAHGRRRVR